MHPSCCLFHSQKHYSKDVCGIAFKSFVALVMTFISVWDILPLRVILSSENRNNSGGERSGDRWVVEESELNVFSKNCLIDSTAWAGTLLWQEEPAFCSSQFRFQVAFFVPHPADISEHSDKHLQEWTRNAQCLSVKRGVAFTGMSACLGEAKQESSSLRIVVWF
jgi:hypothetical protein